MNDNDVSYFTKHGPLVSRRQSVRPSKHVVEMEHVALRLAIRGDLGLLAIEATISNRSPLPMPESLPAIGHDT